MSRTLASTMKQVNLQYVRDDSTHPPIRASDFTIKCALYSLHVGFHKQLCRSFGSIVLNLL